MKNSILITAFLFSIVSLYAQTEAFTIVKTTGQIRQVENSRLLKQGDEVVGSDEVSFENDKASALAIGNDRERYFIRAISDKVLTASVTMASIPVRSRNVLATRGTEESVVTDLRKFFGNTTFCLIGEESDIMLDKNRYPLSNNSFIIFRYETSDGKIIHKKIGFDHQQLVLEKGAILSFEGKHYTPDECGSVTVLFYDKTANKTTEITRFDLKFIDEQVLGDEMMLVLSKLKKDKMSENDIHKYLLDYFFDVYGDTNFKDINLIVDNVMASE